MKTTKSKKKVNSENQIQKIFKTAPTESIEPTSSVNVKSVYVHALLEKLKSKNFWIYNLRLEMLRQRNVMLFLSQLIILHCRISFCFFLIHFWNRNRFWWRKWLKQREHFSSWKQWNCRDCFDNTTNKWWRRSKQIESIWSMWSLWSCWENKSLRWMWKMAYKIWRGEEVAAQVEPTLHWIDDEIRRTGRSGERYRASEREHWKKVRWSISDFVHIRYSRISDFVHIRWSCSIIVWVRCHFYR